MSYVIFSHALAGKDVTDCSTELDWIDQFAFWQTSFHGTIEFREDILSLGARVVVVPFSCSQNLQQALRQRSTVIIITFESAR